MRAFHAYSSRPAQKWFGREQPEGSCRFEDFELLMTILSALSWRRHNGSMKLYTDDACARYFEVRGLEGLWDDGIDTSALAGVRLDTNFSSFWAFAKTVALAHERAPCVVMDMDLVVWKSISHLYDADFMAIHSEPLDFQVYVPRDQMVAPPGYAWDDLDWTVTPCNAALLYFGSEPVRRLCADMGMQFMHNNPVSEEAGSMPTYGVFVEQRLYPMCAARLGASIGHFLQDYHGTRLANGTANTTFTHLWLYKRTLMSDAGTRAGLCRRMIDRLVAEYPDVADVLPRIPELGPYFRRGGVAASPEVMIK